MRAISTTSQPCSAWSEGSNHHPTYSIRAAWRSTAAGVWGASHLGVSVLRAVAQLPPPPHTTPVGITAWVKSRCSRALRVTRHLVIHAALG